MSTARPKTVFLKAPTIAPSFTRLSWGLGDQLVSSASNMLLFAVVANRVSSLDLGSFAIAYSVYLIALALSRSATTEPLAVLRSARSDVRASSAAVYLGLLLGCGFACIILAASRLSTGTTQHALMALAAVLPLLLAQDAARLAAVTAGDARSAFASNAAWTILFVLLLLAANPTQLFETVSSLILAWGGAGSLSGLAHIAYQRLRPSFEGLQHWYRLARPQIRAFSGEYLVSAGIAQGAILCLGLVLGLERLAAFRSAEVAFGPMNILIASARTLGVVEVQKRALGSIAAVSSLAKMVAGVLAISSIAWAMLLLSLPQQFGELLAGETWSAAKLLVPWMAGAKVAFAIASAAFIATRCIGNTKLGSRTRTAAAACVAVCAVGGALIGGLQLAAVGLSAGHLLGAMIWLRTFRTVVRQE